MVVRQLDPASLYSELSTQNNCFQYLVNAHSNWKFLVHRNSDCGREVEIEWVSHCYRCKYTIDECKKVLELKVKEEN